ncbi:MAG: hypothetical protein PF638_05095 [Candidatus Delongbacteria bacterium]|nr:hypothetical protein [Candidatus Delongbacteria bacterium]
MVLLNSFLRKTYNVKQRIPTSGSKKYLFLEYMEYLDWDNISFENWNSVMISIGSNKFIDKDV